MSSLQKFPALNVPAEVKAVDRIRQLLLSLCAGILLPIAFWHALTKSLVGRGEGPTSGSIVDESTHIVNLQDDTVYLGSLSFLLNPYRFLLRCQHALANSSWFRFQFCGKSIVVISDIHAAHEILQNKCFSLFDGHMMLVPGQGLESFRLPATGAHRYSRYIKQLARDDLLQSALEQTIHGLVQDIHQWGDSGVIRGWDTLAEMVYGSCFSFVAGGTYTPRSPTLRSYVRNLKWVAQCVSPDAMVLPWFPTPSRLRYILGSTRIYNMLFEILEARRSARDTSERVDVVDIVLADGLDTPSACKILMTILLMASFDTSKTVFWLIAYLLQHPIWLNKVRQEVSAFMVDFTTAGSEDLASLLTRIPLAEWESPQRFQSLDLCLRETMRLVANGTLPRRNLGEDIVVDGHTIRYDEFVLLMTENLHFDESVYDEPMRFMPDRDLTVAEARGSFVGWGRGVHPCPGKRYAQLLVRAIVVVVLGQYNLQINRDDDLPPGIVPGIVRNLTQSSVADPVEELRFVYRACSM